MHRTSAAGPADLSRFLAVLKRLERHPQAMLRGFFHSGLPVIVARAPGRLDVMGGIADYSGALVLQWPIAEATFAAVQTAQDGTVLAASLPAHGAAGTRIIQLPSHAVQELAETGYAAAQARLTGNPQTSWAAYVLGVVLVLMRERTARLDGGLRILVWSNVPEAKGLSSSAAVEVAVMQATAHALGQRLDGIDLAQLCQLAENHVAGAPCGIMDQMTAALGRADHLLALLCQPAEVKGFLAMPKAVRLWGIDSGIRHAVSGSDYRSVRVGAFMGHRILDQLAGRAAQDQPPCDGPRWGGYLANLSAEEFQRQFADRIPHEMTGAAFLSRYGGIADPVTRVDPLRTYAVRQPTTHPIDEHQRVCRFAALLAAELTETALCELGTLMYASHASYSVCGLGSDGTDRLVQLVREAGPKAGLFGAKITGGGSGGTVAVLGRADAAPAVATVATQYARLTGRTPAVHTGSSMGACDFGIRHLRGGTLHNARGFLA